MELAGYEVITDPAMMEQIIHDRVHNQHRVHNVIEVIFATSPYRLPTCKVTLMRCPPHVDDVIEILSRTSLCGLNTLDHNRVIYLYDKLQSKTLLVALNTHPVPTLIQ